MQVGDHVRLPTWVVMIGRSAVVTLIDGKYAKVRRYGTYSRKQIWIAIADLDTEHERAAEHRRQRQRRRKQS